jgi:hypothetical protein
MDELNELSKAVHGNHEITIGNIENFEKRQFRHFRVHPT